MPPLIRACSLAPGLIDLRFTLQTQPGKFTASSALRAIRPSAVTLLRHSLFFLVWLKHLLWSSRAQTSAWAQGLRKHVSIYN